MPAMITIYDLPKPPQKALKRSQALTQFILQEIHAHHGKISFSEFMQLALYHPEWGYYNAQTFTLGKSGDFTTAPEISPLFAACFAKQIMEISPHLSSNNILEIGAGSGRFAKDLLTTLNKHDQLPDHYYIYDISTSLRKKQKSFLRSTCPELFSRLIWLDELPEQFTGCVIANEVLDALPVHCFRIHQDDIQERYVSDDQQELTWQYASISSPALAQRAKHIHDLYDLPTGYEFEICSQLKSFIHSLVKSIHKGVILFSDYGYGENEYFHPERHQGTLTCFYQHLKHSHPLWYPGLQDITSHVNFTHVIEEAVDAGCELAGYTSQAAFLLSCGLMDLAAENMGSEVEQFNMNHAIKLLTFPTEMGERVKIMAINKNIENLVTPLLGFRLHDRKRDL